MVVNSREWCPAARVQRALAEDLTGTQVGDNIPPSSKTARKARPEPQPITPPVVAQPNDGAANMLSDSSPTPTPQRPTLASIAKRSLLPIAAVGLLLSTMWIGPFGFLVAALGWWQIVRRIH